MRSEAGRSDGALALRMRLPALMRRLAAWYGPAQRPLPWRQTRDPYAIWISEVMLQQTQVATVIPYFERFLSAYPDVARLAAADTDSLLRAWQGLGYYRRAHNLLLAAREIQALREWPRTVEGLQRLPGIGRSTAGAIASLAFGVRAPILDGNVRRVWSRLGALDARRTAAWERELFGLSEEAVRRGDPARINQSLMELGATICLPKGPLCSECPVRSGCEAFRSGDPEAFPPASVRRPKRVLDVSVALLVKGDRFLVTRRPDGGFLGGLWELPGGKWESGEDAVAALRREMHEELGISVAIDRSYPPVAHAYTHFEVRLHPFHCRPSGKRTLETALPSRWIRRSDIPTLAFPAGTLKVFREIWPSFPKSASRRVAETP